MVTMEKSGYRISVSSKVAVMLMGDGWNLVTRRPR